jgi:hypothetical protein
MVYHGTTDNRGTNVPPRKPWYILPGYYRGHMYRGEMYHGFGGGTYVPWYTMVQLFTMVPKYHPKSLDTCFQGNAVVKCTMVKCSLVFMVVQVYHGLPWYH